MVNYMTETMNTDKHGTENRAGDMMKKIRVKKEFFESTEVILKNHRGIIRHIKILEDTMSEIKEYKSRGIKSISTDGIRVSSSPGDSIGNQIVKISEMMERVQREIDDEKKYVTLVKKGMADLSDQEKEIIEMRYFDNIPDSKIALYTNYERSNIFRKRVAAVRKLAVVIYGIKCLES